MNGRLGKIAFERGVNASEEKAYFGGAHVKSEYFWCSVGGQKGGRRGRLKSRTFSRAEVAKIWIRGPFLFVGLVDSREGATWPKLQMVGLFREVSQGFRSIRPIRKV